MTQVPLASLATPEILILSSFSSAKPKPTQPSEPGLPVMPSTMTLSLADEV